MEDIDLAAYGFSPHLGFITEDPLRTLPPYFSAWQELVEKLDDIRSHPNKTILEAVSSLPLLDHNYLTDQKQLRLAHTLLSFLGMSYVHEDPVHPAHVLPAQLAVPWAAVSRRLGLPPIILHASVSLCNWRKIDPLGPMTLPNLTLLYSLDSTRDLEVFFLVPLLVELTSVPSVTAIVKAQAAISSQDSATATSSLTTVISALATIQECLVNMKSALEQMSPGCRPRVFYDQHRPLLSGWRDNPSLPQGLLYQGVSKQPLMYSGGSAAQSAAIQIIDAGLGIIHGGKEGDFLTRMLDYMPPNQADLIRAIRRGPSLREFCESGGRKAESESLGGKARSEYNKCLDKLEEFRTAHLVLVSRYITTPSNMGKQNIEHLTKQGTGGTPLANFLKNIRTNIQQAKI